MPTLLLRAASAAACSAVNGGASTISTPVMSLTKRAKLLDVLHGLGDRLVHLPVAGDERVRIRPDRRPKPEREGVRRPCATAGPTRQSSASGNTATPGSVRPPRNSSEAPPPVEMCVMRSATPAFVTAAIESPPPTIVVPLHAGHRFGHRHRPFRERVDLEHAHRPVPDHRLRVAKRARVLADRVRPDVQPHALADRRVVHRQRLRSARPPRASRRRRDRTAAAAAAARCDARAMMSLAPRRACRPRRATCRPACRAP